MRNSGVRKTIEDKKGERKAAEDRQKDGQERRGDIENENHSLGAKPS